MTGLNMLSTMFASLELTTMAPALGPNTSNTCPEVARPNLPMEIRDSSGVPGVKGWTEKGLLEIAHRIRNMQCYGLPGKSRPSDFHYQEGKNSLQMYKA